MSTVYQRVTYLRPVGEDVDAPVSRLRLTRRGRLVIGLLISLVIVAALALATLFAATGAQASLDERAVEFTYVSVQPGDSLWGLAGRLAPAADPRDVIDDIMRLNQLDSANVVNGQQLAIPLEYTSR